MVNFAKLSEFNFYCCAGNYNSKVLCTNLAFMYLQTPLDLSTQENGCQKTNSTNQFNVFNVKNIQRFVKILDFSIENIPDDADENMNDDDIIMTYYVPPLIHAT